jgi:hypothetical protein
VWSHALAGILVSTGLLAGPVALATAPSPGAIQATGVQLESALLPSSAFGPGGMFSKQDSGRTLERGSYPDLAADDCALFSVLLGDSSLPGDPSFGFGSTANATEDIVVSGRSYRAYSLGVFQFGSAHAAASLYAQMYAKYAKCRSFAVSGVRIRLNSEAKTSVNGHPAFRVTQTTYNTGLGAPPPVSSDTLFAIDGADAFVVNMQVRPIAPSASTTPTALSTRLIARVQALR